MAITVAQRPSGHDDGGLTGSVAVTFGSPNTSGNAIIAIGLVAAFTNSGLSTPTDTAGNSYTKALSINDTSSNLGVVIWTCFNINSGANTVTMNDGNNISVLRLYEVSGLTTIGAFDTSAHQYQTTATALDSTSTGTTQVSNELLLGIFAAGTATPLSFTAGAGYSNMVDDGINFLSTGTEEKIVAATGAYNATATYPVNSDFELSVIATFGNSARNITTSSTITSSDVIPSYYSDQTNVMESYSLLETAFINVSDTISSSENLNSTLVNLVDVTDTTTTSELVSIGGLLQFSIVTSDTIGDSDAVQVFTQLGDIVKSDTATTSENTQLLDTLNASVHDNTTISESLGNLDIDMPMISDTLTSSESVGMLVSPLVQIAKNTSSTTSVTATFGATPTSGNLMVAIVWGNASAASTPTMSGWTLQQSQPLTGFQTATFFYKVAGASESTSVTASLTNGTAMEIETAEYAFTGSTIDAASFVADTGVNTTSRSAGTVTTSDRDLIVASMGFNSNQGGGLSWSNSFTGRGVGANTALAETTATTPSTYTTTASWTTGVHATGFLVAFSKAQSIAVSDTSTHTESIKLLQESNPDVFDTISSDDSSVSVFVSGADLIVAVSDSIASSDIPQISGDKVLPVSDNIALSDSLSHYIDSVDVEENVQLFLQTGNLIVGVSDQINSSENNVGSSDKNIAVSDSTTTSEYLDVLHNNTRDIILTDTRLFDQNGNPILDENGNPIYDQNTPGDYVNSSEAVTVAIATDFFINVHDNTSLSEVAAVFLPITRGISTFDSIASSEHVSLRPDFIFLTTSDTVLSSEHVALSPENNPNVSDTIVSSDVPITAVTPLFVTASDTVHSSENIAAVIPAVVVVTKALALILLDNGHLAIRLGGNFYQIL